MFVVVDGSVGDRLGKGLGFGAGNFLTEGNPLGPRGALLVKGGPHSGDLGEVLPGSFGTVMFGIDTVYGLVNRVE